MNERARAILEYIQRFTREKGFPPTIREIGEAFHITSTNGVRYHLTLLEKGGHLRRRGKISRGIETFSQMQESGIPILGRVAAGAPILAEQSFEGKLEIGQIFGEPKGLFALRVRGDSMIGAGIFEKDYVVVRHQEQAAAGQMIVALLDEEEATVKYYQPRRGHIELVADNPTFDPIVVTPDMRFKIIGVVKGVVRTI